MFYYIINSSTQINQLHKLVKLALNISGTPYVCCNELCVIIILQEKPILNIIEERRRSSHSDHYRWTDPKRGPLFERLLTQLSA